MTTTVPVTEQLAGRLFDAGINALELVTVLLGERLGYYRALADHGPVTSAELATLTGTDERYTREWCEQQAIAELIAVEADRFAMLPGAEAVLLDVDSPAYLVQLGAFLESVAGVAPALETAFRTGGGVPFGDYHVQHAQGALNRPVFTQLLVQDWLPQIPDVDEALRSGGTVAEFGCGEGWAAIALAAGYPDLRVDGFDADPPSIATARRNAEAAGVADRVRFTVADVTDPALTGSYDAVFAFEMLHDLAHPVAALESALRITAGPVIVMDEKVADAFGAFGDPLERFFYAASVLHCLPAGRCEEQSAATGTVMRPATLRRYATDAGFAGMTVLPIEHDVFRFYRLDR